MGWASGSELGEKIIKSANLHFKGVYRENRVGFYMDLIEALEDADCDTVYELEGINKDFDIALNEYYSE